MSTTYVFTITCKVAIEAGSREEANTIFSEQYSDNLNQFIVTEEVEDGKERTESSNSF